MSMLRVEYAVLAMSWKMASGSDVVCSVLKLKRHVRDGCRRPCSKLGMIARQLVMFRTRVGMWSGAEIVRGWTLMLRMSRTFVLP